MESIFELEDYRQLLIEDVRDRGHGGKIQLAEAIRVQSSFLSRVLARQAHLSAEQGLAFCHVRQMDAASTEHFIIKLQWARAKTPELKKFYQSQIKLQAKQSTNIQKRIGKVQSISREDQRTYYSHWIYSAIHALVSLPGLNSAQAISRHLGVDHAQASEWLEALAQMGILIKDGRQYITAKARLHLGTESAMLSSFHRNWRLRTCREFDRTQKTQSLHYSSATTLSHEDAAKIHQTLLDTISQIKARIKESPEETGRALTLDFFEI